MPRMPRLTRLCPDMDSRRIGNQRQPSRPSTDRSSCRGPETQSASSQSWPRPKRCARFVVCEPQHYCFVIPASQPLEPEVRSLYKRVSERVSWTGTTGPHPPRPPQAPGRARLERGGDRARHGRRSLAFLRQLATARAHQGTIVHEDLPHLPRHRRGSRGTGHGGPGPLDIFRRGTLHGFPSAPPKAGADPRATTFHGPAWPSPAGAHPPPPRARLYAAVIDFAPPRSTAPARSMGVSVHGRGAWSSGTGSLNPRGTTALTVENGRGTNTPFCERSAPLTVRDPATAGLENRISPHCARRPRRAKA